MKPQEMIDVIQAHADGKQLQMRPKGDAMWVDCKPPSPMFDFCHYYYRVKVTLRPHWPCVCKVGRDIFLTDSLYADVADAIREVEGSGGTVIRLATEYPPVMLP